MSDARRFQVGERPENGAHPDAVLRALAARQHGVVARRQLEAAGVTLSMLKSRVASGRLIRLHRGVYAVGHAQLRLEGRWLAAVLAAGVGAVLSHRDAAALHGLRRPGDHARWEVTTTRRASSTGAIRVFGTTALGPLDATTVAGIPATSVARTLVDLAGVVPASQLRSALNEAEHRQLFDLKAIEDALERTRSRNGRGHAAMRAALAALAETGVSLTRSELEDRFLALLDARALPRPRTNYGIEGMEVDACWPDRALVAELDGWAAHGTRRAFQRDRTKANDLTAAGWTVLHFTHADVVRRPNDAAARVAQALAAPRRYPPTP